MSEQEMREALLQVTFTVELAERERDETRKAALFRVAENLARVALSTPPAAPVVPEPVAGDVLPPVGNRVWIRHGRDDAAHACIVTGYYAWRDLGGDQRLHRVFVRLVYEGTSTQQARMLCDCYATEADALAAAPAPSQEPKP